MTKAICSIPQCEKLVRATGWCRDHYNRWYQTGDPTTPPAHQLNLSCKADDCGARPRSRTADYCERHYCRLRRIGSLDLPPRSTQCVAPECLDPVHYKGMCSIHLGRYRRHGTFEPLAGPGVTGESNHAWRGNSVGYGATHSRLRNSRGLAPSYSCVDCGKQAEHWSYNHGSEIEQQSDFGPYSTDLDSYEPRCVACHKSFDLAHLAPGPFHSFL